MAIGWLDASETEISAECVEQLRRAGWIVKVLAQDRPTRQQLEGLPDCICFRHDVTLMIEFKSARGELNEAQVEFYFALRDHLGEHLHYEIVNHPKQIARWCEGD